MKLPNVIRVNNFEEALLPHVRLDLKEKMLSADVFVLAYKSSVENLNECEEVILMRDLSGKCKNKDTFDCIDFEVISNEDFENSNSNYFKGKCICCVVKSVNDCISK